LEEEVIPFLLTSRSCNTVICNLNGVLYQFKINAKMKKLIGQNELNSPWRMFEVDFNLIISIMAKK
jgi:hypothetical protein